MINIKVKFKEKERKFISLRYLTTWHYSLKQKKNKNKLFFGFVDTGHLNDIMTYVVIGVVVMFIVGATAGVYVTRDHFMKRRTQHAGESCATYDRVRIHFQFR